MGDIGKPFREIELEPIERPARRRTQPTPSPDPAPAPATPVPEREPEKVPA